jgi:iron only hydrogenase large subunit-like protein
MPPTQALMNLAFKAQNQSRLTLQALLGLKQPKRSTFVKQANIAHGHQQVNNLAEKNQNSQNKALERKAMACTGGCRNGQRVLI